MVPIHFRVDEELLARVLDLVELRNRRLAPLGVPPVGRAHLLRQALAVGVEALETRERPVLANSDDLDRLTRFWRSLGVGLDRTERQTPAPLPICEEEGGEDERA